jgi:hypothetical protein
MTTNIIHELADKWWPLPPEKFFTMQRAPDMWFGDELPPTIQDEMRNPAVVQAKMIVRYQIGQQLMAGEQKRIMEAEKLRRVVAVSRVGKRAKTRRN